jgi:putative N-acetylmannosamine-6-phosphate epimerase
VHGEGRLLMADVSTVDEGLAAQARRALQLGAWAVVVGTAITAPAWITGQFVRELATACQAVR